MDNAAAYFIAHQDSIQHKPSKPLKFLLQHHLYLYSTYAFQCKFNRKRIPSFSLSVPALPGFPPCLWPGEICSHSSESLSVAARLAGDDTGRCTLLERHFLGLVMIERVSNLTYPTLQHCLRMLYTTNGNSEH